MHRLLFVMTSDLAFEKFGLGSSNNILLNQTKDFPYNEFDHLVDEPI